MRKTVSTCFAVALVALWGMAAQGQQAPQPPAPPSDGPSRPAPDAAPPASDVTLAGCIARDGEAFKLTDAKAAAGAPAAADVKDEYTLAAATGVNLAPHVGHQVEVTGQAGAGDTASFSVSAVKMIADKCE